MTTISPYPRIPARARWQADLISPVAGRTSSLTGIRDSGSVRNPLRTRRLLQQFLIRFLAARVKPKLGLMQK